MAFADLGAMASDQEEAARSRCSERHSVRLTRPSADIPFGITILSARHPNALGYIVSTKCGGPADGQLLFGDCVVSVDGEAASGAYVTKELLGGRLRVDLAVERGPACIAEAEALRAQAELEGTVDHYSRRSRR